MRKFVMIACLLAAGIMYSDAGIYDPSDITEIMERVCDYGLRLFPSSKLPSTNEEWATGVFHTGVLAAYYSTGQQRFLDSATAFATFNNWKLIGGGDANVDIHAQTYCELYLLDPKPENSYMIADFISVERSYISWGFGDALFMAPPAYVRLGAATKDTSLFSFVNRKWQRTIDMLFDWDAGMIYTLSEYIYPLVQTTNGKKMFWSRGNGWVTSGAVRVLEYLPENDPGREQYINLLRVMAASISKVQGSDGLWRTSLLDSLEYPGPETSGSALFCHSFAYGIRMGYLDSATYIPVVLKAWKGLMEKVTPEGRVTCSQRPSTIPSVVYPDNTDNFTVGVFLLAGREMLLLNYRNDTTPPAPVVMNSAEALYQDIRISWQAGVDAESGIDGYEIYRDTAPGAAKLLKTVRRVTEYTDMTNQENTTYYYRLKAFNGKGLRSAGFSNEVSATTHADTVKPAVVSVQSRTTSVQICFNEKVEQASAENAGNYTIDNSIQVTSASLQSDKKTVKLIVSPLAIETTYSLHISGIRDQAAIANTMNPLDTAFSIPTHATISITADNVYELYFNGRLVGSNSNWNNVEKYPVNLQAGKNVIAVKGIDIGAPGGLLAEIGLDSSTAVLSGTSTAWKTSLQEQAEWTTTGFDDAAWTPATGIGAYGISPWGRITGMPAGTTAQWIWGDGGSDTVFFRYVIDDFDDFDTDNEPGTITPENLDLTASPNPFNPSVHISYSLPQKAEVSLTLYNPQGKMVRKLAIGMASEGRHMLQVDAGGLASGIYICELKSSATAKRLKLVLMR